MSIVTFALERTV